MITPPESTLAAVLVAADWLEKCCDENVPARFPVERDAERRIVKATRALAAILAAAPTAAHVAELEAALAAAEARLRAVEALADEWADRAPDHYTTVAHAEVRCERELRAALTPPQPAP